MQTHQINLNTKGSKQRSTEPRLIMKTNKQHIIKLNANSSIRIEENAFLPQGQFHCI